MFLDLDAGVQRCGVIVRENGDGGLDEDGAAINFGADEVDSAAGDFDLGGEGLFDRSNPRKAR